MTTLPIATKYRSGLMGAADKDKLDAIPDVSIEDANKVIVVNASGDGFELESINTGGISIGLLLALT